GVLDDEADEVGQLPGRVGGGVPAGDQNPALEGAAREVGDEAVDGPQEGRLARSGPSHDEAQLALLDGQVDLGQRGGAGSLVGEGDVLEADHGVAPEGGAGATTAGRRAQSTPTAGR